uniref:Major facilitator superfamily (MFS) profile domain-containing protein n=1 Tax=Knipowitschia caucasica TaxID=637954 RepID=A0AAV2LSE4_KNICA
MLSNTDKLPEDEEPNRSSWTATLVLTVCSAAIGGTFQYGYNISIINAPTSYIQTFINDTYMERWGVGLDTPQVIGLTEILGGKNLWPFLLASNAIPAVIQVLTLPWFPESPRYLLIDKGDRQSCERALSRLRGGDVPIAEMQEMMQEKEQLRSSAVKSNSTAKTPWALLKDPHLQTQLRTVMAASSAMMLCGNDSIYFYAYYIFLAAGISPQHIQYATIGTGASEFLSSILSNYLIERAGRRYLLIGGYSLMSCWGIVFTIALVLQGQGVAGMAYLSMACVFAYILSFGLGPAGVTGILPAEIFDQAARPAAYMIAGSFMWVSLFLVGMVFPFIISYFGNFCLLPFVIVCVAAAAFLGWTLTETKGKTLTEITLEFDKKNAVGGENRPVGSPSLNQYHPGKTCSFTSLTDEEDPVEKSRK